MISYQSTVLMSHTLYRLLEKAVEKFGDQYMVVLFYDFRAE